MSTPAPAVWIDGLGKSYSGKVALAGVTLDLTGGLVGLLGPNGAGKTTLLRILSTVLRPDTGAVRVLGKDPTDPLQRLALRRDLGYLPQDPGFQRGFTAFEFVDYVAILKEWTDRRTRHEEVRRVLAEVGLAAESGHRVQRLSGGTRRRVALASALIGDPAVLVLDEPTAGLDPEQRLRFRDVLSRTADGRIVIISTHQTEDVAAMCNEVVVLHRGEVLYHGTPSRLCGLAAGRVWLADARDESAKLAWRTGAGRHRHLGDAPVGADLLHPTLEDGYLLLVGEEEGVVPA